LAHIDVLEGDFFGNKVDSPNSNAVVMNSDELRVCVVEESDLVGNIHTNWIST
jgi:hypothetical protein